MAAKLDIAAELAEGGVCVCNIYIIYNYISLKMIFSNAHLTLLTLSVMNCCVVQLFTAAEFTEFT